jgi:tetratricopeptide (TPR) repeat protein
VVGKKNQSALLAKYYNMYKKNPRSRVFAPLAESFRKLGMLEDAYKILKDGIRNHPNYALGYIVLAHCYYDEQKYELTYRTLRPIINQNADNISLQKVFAQACIHLGHLEEALDTFKYLLFMNPKDKFFAEQVKKLEDDLLVGHKKLSLDQLVKAPDMLMPVQTETSFDDDWVQVDFNRPPKKDEAQPLIQEKKEESLIDFDDQWVMRKPEPARSEMKETPSVQEKPVENVKEHPILKEVKLPERSLEDDYYADEFEEEGDIDDVNASSISSDTPIVSHTLIDLYCAQHYYDKAIELLEKILELNPGEPASVQKLEKVKQLRLQHAASPVVTTEEAGHDELISIIENQVKAKSPQEIKVQQAFDQFLGLVKQKASSINL